MDIKLKIGLRIDALKQQRGLSNTFLAWDADLDPSYIVDVIKGNRNISVLALSKICTALSVSIREFYDDPLFEYINNQEAPPPCTQQTTK